MTTVVKTWPAPGDLLKPSHVAKILNVSVPHVYKLIATGMLPAVVWSTPGAGSRRNVVRVRKEDLDRFQEQHRKAA
jgi:excisionase family DNA binding protein